VFSIFKQLPVSISPYRNSLLAVAFFHLLAAVFTVVSIPMIIPFFQLLFEAGTDNAAHTNASQLEQQLYWKVKEAIDAVGKRQTVLWVCLLFIVIFFLKNIFRYLAMYTMTPVRNGWVKDMRFALFDRYNQLSLQSLKRTKKGNLIASMLTDVQETEWMLRHSLETIIKSPLIIVGCVSFMLYLNPRLSFFVFILLIFTVVIIGGISRKLKQESKEAQQYLADISTQVDESVSGHSVIKSYNADSFIRKRFNYLNEGFTSMYNKVLRRRDLASPLSEVLGVTIVAVLLWYGSREVFNAKMSPEAFFAFLFAFFQIIEPSKSFATAYYTIQKGMGALERINEVFSIPIGAHSGTTKINAFNQSLRFEHVSFRHDDDTEDLFSALDFTINKGDIVSIEGPSGIGKTTVLQLLLQFTQPTEGQIFVDNTAIADVELKDYRNLIAYVDQQVNILHDTIQENICLGKLKDQERIKQSLIDAYAWKFVSAMPEGINQMLGERGSRLSGGQQQRIAIARAFYHNAPILILDEATNAIDEESKQLIMKAIRKKNEENALTVILVSHDEMIQNMASKRVQLSD
jgi:subfamily B ATP-binding cassette protein MsbA